MTQRNIRLKLSHTQSVYQCKSECKCQCIDYSIDNKYYECYPTKGWASISNGACIIVSSVNSGLKKSYL